MIKQGQLLVAPPQMLDTRFARTVLLLTHHNSQGSFALCLNKPTGHTMAQASLEMGLDKQLPFSVYWGGPVNNGSIWMVHTTDWDVEETINVNRSWNVSSTKEMFSHLADGDTPREFRICAGMATWAPGQLDMEIDGMHPFDKRSSWLTVDKPDPDHILNLNDQDIWEACVHKVGSQTIDTWL